MFLVEAGKKLKQKEVGCSIWQSMQNRRLLQQWWNHKKRYKNSFSRMRFSRMFIYLQKAFAFIYSFLFYLHQWHKFLQTTSWPELNIPFKLFNEKKTKIQKQLRHWKQGKSFVLCWSAEFLSALTSFLKRCKRGWFGSIYEIWFRTGRPNYVKFN